MGDCEYRWYNISGLATRGTWCRRGAEAHEWCTSVLGKASRLSLSMAVLGALLGSHR